MNSSISYPEREARLLALTANAKRLNNDALVQVLGIADEDRSRIKTALNIFLWTCLQTAHPAKNFLLTDDMLHAHGADIAVLPNVTPNGLVLPKRENLTAFNLLQKIAGEAFGKLGLGSGIARMQYPVNIRLQNGAPNAVVDARPRASVKPHSDIWAGDPASGILVFLSVLGSTENSGIRFFKPKAFPTSYVRTLEDYNDGAPLMEGAAELDRFDERGWFLADPYLLHQTTKRGAGQRISLDFRIIPSQQVSSDIDEDAARKPFFMSFDEWMKLGASTWVATNEGMMEFEQVRKKDPYTIGYPVKIFLKPMEAHDESDYTQAAC